MLSPRSYTAMLCPLDEAHDAHYHTYADYKRHMIADHKSDAVESVLLSDRDIEQAIRDIARQVTANLIDYAPDDTDLLTLIANEVGAMVIAIALATDGEG